MPPSDGRRRRRRSTGPRWLRRRRDRTPDLAHRPRPADLQAAVRAEVRLAECNAPQRAHAEIPGSRSSWIGRRSSSIRSSARSSWSTAASAPIFASTRSGRSRRTGACRRSGRRCRGTRARACGAGSAAGGAVCRGRGSSSPARRPRPQLLDDDLRLPVGGGRRGPGGGSGPGGGRREWRGGLAPRQPVAGRPPAKEAGRKSAEQAGAAAAR